MGPPLAGSPEGGCNGGLGAVESLAGSDRVDGARPLERQATSTDAVAAEERPGSGVTATNGSTDRSAMERVAQATGLWVVPGEGFIHTALNGS